MSPADPPRSQPDRHEPLPSLPELPRWLWTRMSRRVRIGAGVTLLAAIAAAAVLLPAIQASNRERSEARQRERAAQREQLIRALAAEQRPVAGRSGAVAPASAARPERLAARAAALRDLRAAIERDARGRVRAGELNGPIRRVACQPFPRSTDRAGAERDLSRRSGRYACLAVTAEFERSENSVGGVIGHQYRARLDFRSGRFAFCKVSGRAGPEREQLVTIPRRCGGD